MLYVLGSLANYQNFPKITQCSCIILLMIDLARWSSSYNEIISHMK